MLTLACDYRLTSPGKGKGEGRRKACQSEVPAGRFKQLLRKNGQDLPLKSICIAGCTTNGVMLVVDGQCLVGLCFTSDLRRVFINVIKPLVVVPKWLPVSPAMLDGGGAAYQYSSVLKQALRLDKSGLVTMYSVDTGKCTAVVDIPTYAAEQPDSSNGAGGKQNAVTQRSFVSLEIGPDGLWLAAQDENNNVVVASLNTYFEAFPSHRAEFWSAAIVVAPSGTGSAGEATPDADSESDDSESSSDEDDEDDEDGEDGEDSAGRSTNAGPEGVLSAGAASKKLDALENDSNWMDELLGYGAVLNHQAKDTRTDSIERQWFEDATTEGSSAGMSQAQNKQQKRLKSMKSSSSLLPAVALTSSLSKDAKPASKPISHRSGFVYLESLPNSALQGMVVTAISILRFFRPESDSSVGDLEVYHLQTNERRSHRVPEAAAIVKCQHDLPALHLTETAVMAFVMQTTRRELVDELIMFEHTTLAEHLCSLNGWDRHTLNTHQLETGLMYRQLDVVDKVLVSLDPDQLVTAYGLVVETVEEATRLSKGVDFAQRLLQLTSQHLNGIVESAFTEDSTAAQYLPDLVGYLCRLRANLIHPRVRTITAETSAVVGVVNYIPQDVEVEDADGYDIEADVPALQARHAEEVLTSESTLYPAEVHKDFLRWRSLSDDEVVQYALQTDTVLNAQIYLALKEKAAPARGLGDDMVDEDYFGKQTSGSSPAEIGNGDGPDLSSSSSNSIASPDDGTRAKVPLWTHSQFRSTALTSVFDAICRGEISDAVTILTSLGEDVQAHLRWVYSRTSRADIRQVLLDAKGDPAGLHGPDTAINRAVAFMDQVSELYPSEDVAGSTKARVVDSKAKTLEDMADFPYQELVPVTASKRWRTSPRTPSAVPATNNIKDANAPEMYTRDEPSTVPSQWYAQLLVSWVKDWDEVTRDRVLLEATGGDASSLRVSDLGRLHYSLTHGDIDEILQVLPDVLAGSSSSSADNSASSSPCRLAFIDILMRWKRLTDSIHALPASAKSDWRPLVESGKLFAVGAPSVEQHVAFLRYASEHGLVGPALRYTQVHNLQDLIVTELQTSDDGHQAASPWIVALGELMNAADAGADVAISHAYARLVLDIPPSAPMNVPLMVEQQRAVAALATILFAEIDQGDASVAAHKVPYADDIAAGTAANDQKPSDLLSADQLRTVVGVYPLLAAQMQVPTDATKAAYERVSVYNLLSACPKLGFGAGATVALSWQAKGPRADMPHFSGEMTERHGAKETLNYQYYLGQGRPFHAFELYQASVSDGSSPTQPHMLAIEVQDLAMSQFRNSRVASACLLFLELVHEDTPALLLRDEITAARRIFAYRCRMYGSNVTALLDTTAREVAVPFVANHHGRQADTGNGASTGKLLADLQKATDWQFGALPNGERKVSLHAAGQEWRLVNRVFKHFGRTPPRLYLKHCAEAGSWLEFLAFSQIEGIDSLQVDRLAGGFKDIAIRQHIRSAVRRVQRDQAQMVQRQDDGASSGSGSGSSASALARKASINRRAGFFNSVGVRGSRMPNASGGGDNHDGIAVHHQLAGHR